MKDRIALLFSALALLISFVSFYRSLERHDFIAAIGALHDPHSGQKRSFGAITNAAIAPDDTARVYFLLVNHGNHSETLFRARLEVQHRDTIDFFPGAREAIGPLVVEPGRAIVDSLIVRVNRATISDLGDTVYLHLLPVRSDGTVGEARLLRLGILASDSPDSASYPMYVKAFDDWKPLQVSVAESYLERFLAKSGLRDRWHAATRPRRANVRQLDRL